MSSNKQTTLQYMPEPNPISKPLPEAEIDLRGFQKMSMGDQWRLYFGDISRDFLGITEEIIEKNDTIPRIPSDSGPATILARIMKWNMSDIIDDPHLIAQAQRVKGRIFSEILRGSLVQPGLLQTEPLQGTASVIEERIVVLSEIAIALGSIFLVSSLLLVSLFWFSRMKRRPLQLQADPGSTMGLALLLNPQLTASSTLRKMHDASRREIKRTLRSETFLTSGGILTKTNNKTRDWRPRAIRLSNLLALCLFLLLVLAAVLVLNAFATGSKLRQQAFIYEADLSKFGLSLSSFAPISIAPAAISIAISLWWDQIDMTFRLLQPYIAMSQEATTIHHGAGLTYRSKTWFGAAVKAARHRHWLLFMVAIGSTLCQVLTVSMSALFERRTDDISHQFSVNNTLQMRYHPVVTQIDISPLEPGAHAAMVVDQMLKLSSETGTLGSSTANVTISTPAIRIRMDCDTIPEIQNVSSWLGKNEQAVTSAEFIRNQTGLTNFTALRRFIFQDTPAFTTIFTNGNQVQCCNNRTSNHLDTAAIGYWSPTDSRSYPYQDRNWPLSFIPKWVIGPFSKEDGAYNLIFEEQPELQAALCKPIIETTEATVLIDQATGVVHSYDLDGPPIAYDSAWSEAFIRRSPSNTNHQFDLYHYNGPLNVTTSFGVLFFDALFGAAARGNIDQQGGTGNGVDYENLSDNSFNFRDHANGLNMDLMSYSMYAMAGKDPNALLNYTTLVSHANRTLQTFFQHFIQNGLSVANGGHVYQAIDDQTMTKLGRAMDANGTAITQPVYPAVTTGRAGTATVTSRIQILYMNPVATFLSVGILIWLTGTAAVIVCLQRRYTKFMMRNVELIADVLVLVAGSDNFLSVVQERGVALKRDENMRTRLGWFKGSDGQIRWGVELVGGRKAVEWVEAPKQSTTRC
ncbi:hypothetical protein N0V90_009508 [Kalmusia sp. IMI 367209]|nr:hypothetical protein N0V90_009508 [Kalmusia sp. IMI 367209]